MNVCARCVLDKEVDAALEFDAEGVCGQCREHERRSEMPTPVPETESQLKDLFDTIRGKQRYDCVVPFSGGKDGSYLLHLLKNKYELRPLAVTIDYYFISPQTYDNQRRIAESVGFDHLLVRPDPLIAMEMFRRCMLKTGEICIACEFFVFTFPGQVALDMRIPLCAWGTSPNQLATKHAVMPWNPEGFAPPARQRDRGALLDLFEDNQELGQRIFDRYEVDWTRSTGPTAILPYAILGYDAEEVESFVGSIGWSRPTDTGGISSNCRINILHNHLQKQIYGVKDKLERLSAKIRTREVTRPVALKAAQDEDLDVCKGLLEELGIEMSLDEVVDAVQAAKPGPDLESLLKRSI